MCNTKCKNEQCCHEEDLLCCEPVMHCCGGYSEHNNCCPHDKGCCNCCHKCGCCPCCCKLKGRIEDIENTIGGDEGINGELDDIKGSIEQMKENLDDLIEKEYNDVDDIKRDHKKDVDDINDRIDHVEDDCVELDRRVDVLEPAVNSLDVRLTTEIHDRAEQDVVYLNLSKEYTDGKISDLVDNAPEALDTLKEIADALKEDDDVMSALNQLIVEERTAREQGDHILELADDSLSDALTREVHRATIAESGLSSDIAAETARAIAAETALGNRITNEIATEQDRATAAETALNDRITSEIVREATRADNALDTAINGLDSSIPSETNKAIASVVISNGKISAHTKVAIPTKVSDLTNDSNFQTGTQVNTSITDAIDGLDSTISAVTNKAIASVTETNGLLAGTYTDTILKAIQDSNGRNIVNTYVTDISPNGRYIHYHIGDTYTDVLVPYATSTSNADITKTLDAVNGDKLQIGTGAAVNITNAVHAVNADNATKATQDAAGDNISATYLKIANAATDADATLQSNSRTKIATVGNTDIHVTMPVIPDALIQSDWTLNDNTKKDFIKHKPSLATVATSGDYNDLTNKPTLFSGDYNDLTNKPTIPSTSVTIGGTSYTLQQAIDYIIGIIPTQYWSRSNGNLTPATATDTVTAPAFYDSSVN